MTTRDALDQGLHLTERQRQVLDMLARGKTNPQIADALGISLPGAKWHVSEVMNKLGVASREEAVESWQSQQRARARASRIVRGFVSVGLLKWAAIGGGAASVAAAGAVAVAVLRPQEPEQAPRVAAAVVAPAALFSTDEAEQRAKELIVQVLAPYTPHVATPDEEAEFRANPFTWRPGGGLQPPGRPVETGDYVIVDAQFLPAVTSVETNVTGRPLTFVVPRDVWVVRMATQPPWEPVRPAEAGHLVVFEDGTGELIAGGLIGDIPVRTSDPATADYSEGTYLAESTSGSTTFWLYAMPPFERPAESRLPAWEEGTICPQEVDSRMPGGFGGTCLVPAIDPVSNPMESWVHNSQGFAHAKGLVAENVAAVRAVTEDGREVIVEPGPAVEGEPWRGFIAVAPGAEWFILVQALDAEGNVIDSSDAANHPTNPPPPGSTHPVTP